jgi:kynurenine formamidase
VIGARGGQLASSESPESEAVPSALRHLTEATVLAALGSARTGQVVSLNSRLDGPTPTTRPRLRRHLRLHNVIRQIPDGRYVVLNDDIIEVATQGSSQWDTFAHCGAIEPGVDGIFLGGLGLDETAGDGMPQHLGLSALGPGVVTRGVLLDTVAVLRPDDGFLADDDRVDRAVVEACLKRQGAELRPGDAVFIYTGFGRRYSHTDEKLPQRAGGIDFSTMPLWADAKVSALISDNMAVESSPADFRVHITALRDLGIPLGELWALEELAGLLRSQERYDFLLASVPLNLPYAFGSPANAVAVL